MYMQVIFNSEVILRVTKFTAVAEAGTIEYWLGKEEEFLKFG